MCEMYVVVPCFNEEKTLVSTYNELYSAIEKLKSEKLIKSGKILFVNDKSTDMTENLLKNICTEESNAESISMEKNSGQQKAILAGLKYAVSKCDFIITADCDLQDDIKAMREMVICRNRGCDIVYGVRSDRKSDSFIKRATAELYYIFIGLIDKSTVKNHGDFRLMSKEAAEKIIKYCGKYPYIRGLAPKLGFKSGTVYYTRRKRTAGKSKYNIRKMLYLSFCGFYTSFIKIKDR